MKLQFFLAIAMFASGCALYLMAALLPDISRDLGIAVPMLAQGVTVFSLSYVFFAPAVIALFDGYSVKRTLLLSLSICLLGNILTLFSNGLTIFLMSRVLAGLGAGIFLPSCVSTVSRLIKRRSQGKGLSFLWTANSLGVVVGIPFALTLSSTFTWKFAIAFVLVLLLIPTLGLCFLQVNESIEAPPSIRERLELLKSSEVLRVVCVTGLTGVGSLGLYSYISIFFQSNSQSLSYAVTAWGLGGVIGSQLVGRVLDKMQNSQKLMTFIIFFLILSISLIPFFQSENLIWFIPFLFWGVFGWASVVPQQHRLMRMNPKIGSTLLALNASFLSLGGAVGTFLIGLLQNLEQLPIVVLAFSVLVLLIASAIHLQFGFRKIQRVGL